MDFNVLLKMTEPIVIESPNIGLRQDWWILTRWKVSSGDTVAVGGIVAVLDNDEAQVDLEVFDDGQIEFLVQDGDRVKAGQPIAHIRS